MISVFPCFIIVCLYIQRFLLCFPLFPSSLSFSSFFSPVSFINFSCFLQTLWFWFQCSVSPCFPSLLLHFPLSLPVSYYSTSRLLRFPHVSFRSTSVSFHSGMSHTATPLPCFTFALLSLPCPVLLYLSCFTLSYLSSPSPYPVSPYCNSSCLALFPFFFLTW